MEFLSVTAPPATKMPPPASSALPEKRFDASLDEIVTFVSVAVPDE